MENVKPSNFHGLLIAVGAIGCVLLVLGIYNVGSVRRVPEQPVQCISNLRLIDSAKNQWALENHKTNGNVGGEDIQPYLGRNAEIPKCPDGGNYTIDGIGEPPKCSIGGIHHTLPR
jgi:hypothetical protein